MSACSYPYVCVCVCVCLSLGSFSLGPVGPVSSWLDLIVDCLDSRLSCHWGTLESLTQWGVGVQSGIRGLVQPPAGTACYNVLKLTVNSTQTAEDPAWRGEHWLQVGICVTLNLLSGFYAWTLVCWWVFYSIYVYMCECVLTLCS